MNRIIGPVVLANSKFSIDLLKELCKANTTGNVIFSPLSISSALGLVLLGARNNTAAEMYKALHFGSMRIMYHYLYEELYKEGEYKNQAKRSLQLVNRLFGDKTFDFNDEFLDVCEEWCFGSLRSVDFKTAPEPARKQINDWVEKICDHLGDVLNPGDVSKDTSLALISAVYFNKKWVNSFTREAGAGRMSKQETLPLGTVPHRQHQRPAEARILEIPYEFNHLSMIIILPNTKEGLPKLLDSITYEQIMEWTQPDNMIEADVYVEMPIFKLEETLDLQTALTSLGIKDLFSEKCDLSGMAPGNPKLSKTVHRSVVEVNEEGTDAEAGGGADVNALQRNRLQESFIVDRPFLFFIRHNSTNTILFWSRVVSPRI